MFCDTIENLSKYIGMDARLAQVEKFLKEQPVNALALGRYELDEGVYAVVSEPVLKDCGPFETHRRYADVQVIVAGGERIDYAPAHLLAGSSGYSEEKDLELFDCLPGEAAPLKLSAGTFAAFWPQDGHRPGLKWTDGAARKIVFKIPV